MNFGSALSMAFVAFWAIVMHTSNDTLASMLMVNAALQVTLFIVVACIPYLCTGRMSWVDIAWPFGLTLIGAQIILLGDGDLARRVVVGAIYLMIGLRMGLGAVTMAWKTGVIFKTEFPRYTYRHMILEQSGRRQFLVNNL